MDSFAVDQNASRKREDGEQMVNAESALSISSRKIANSLRCIEYKNKKVKQHVHD